MVELIFLWKTTQINTPFLHHMPLNSQRNHHATIKMGYICIYRKLASKLSGVFGIRCHFWSSVQACNRGSVVNRKHTPEVTPESGPLRKFTLELSGFASGRCITPPTTTFWVGPYKAHFIFSKRYICHWFLSCSYSLSLLHFKKTRKIHNLDFPPSKHFVPLREKLEELPIYIFPLKEIEFPFVLTEHLLLLKVGDS